MTGRIEVSRSPTPFGDYLRKYQVQIDGKTIGRLPRGQSLAHDVETGVLKVRIRIDWCSSPLVPVDVHEDETVHLACRPSGRFWYAFWRTGTYVHLESA